ncbi:MAG TPA: trigger factor [Candidatus Acidoferrum sp.]|nr:trigger factor [Candidatus Acidoferrum sp.]
MKVEVTDVEACKRRVAVEAPIEVVNEQWESAYGRVQKQARLPGFRKGHVPRSLVKVHFADDVRREVAEHLIPEVYRQALSEARLDPVNEPDIQDLRLEEGAPLSFVAVVEVKPEIALTDYAGVEVEHAPTTITSERVDETLERMREQQAEFNLVDRAAAPGDLVIVDYTLNVEGQEPSTQSGYAFVVGDGSVMREIDEAAVGMRAGDQREVGFRFPDDHRREELRGKPGTAAFKVVEVKEKVLPALDDELAKSLGQFDDLAALRAEVQTQLETRQASEDRQTLEDKIVDALLARHTFGIPESLVMRQIAHQVEHARERMRRQGIDPDRLPWDYDKLMGELRPGAERSVRRALLLEAVAAREGLSATDADVDAEVEKIAQAGQRPTPAVRRMMEKSGDLDALRRGLRERMTLQFLIDRAQIRPAA